jgi:hypothetical protein
LVVVLHNTFSFLYGYIKVKKIFSAIEVASGQRGNTEKLIAKFNSEENGVVEYQQGEDSEESR